MPKARSARIMSNFSTLHASETGRVGDRDKKWKGERERESGHYLQSNKRLSGRHCLAARYWAGQRGGRGTGKSPAVTASKNLLIINLLLFILHFVSA